MATGPALALVAYSSVPAGLRALDGLVKAAQVSVLSSGTVQNGTFLILFAGEVGEVLRSHEACLQYPADLLDEVFLAYAEPRILPAVLRDGPNSGDSEPSGDTLGALEVSALPTLLRAVDAALKGAAVELLELRLGDGLGGRGTALFRGEVHDVEAAMDFARNAVSRARAECTVNSSIMANAEDEVWRAVGKPGRFFGAWRG